VRAIESPVELVRKRVNSRQTRDVVAFPSTSGVQHAGEAAIPRTILHRFLDDAFQLGADLLEIRYKDGYEEVFANVRGFSYRLAALRSAHLDAAQLRDELAIAANHRKRSTALNATELTRSYDVRVDTYDDFGETAYRVTFKRK
jgi:hypothetical protein